EHVSHAEFTRRALHVYSLALIGKRGVAGDYEEPSQLRQTGDDVLGDAIREIFLLDVATDVDEGQHHDRGPVSCFRPFGGGTAFCHTPRNFVQPDAMNANRT